MRADTGDALRIAMVCPYDLSRPGGVQGQARGLVQALRGLGHDAWLVAPDDAPVGWSAPDRYVAGRSRALRANGSEAPVCLSPAGARRAVRAARERGAQVVHLHEPLAPALGYGFLAARRWPTVATFHRSGTDRLTKLASPLARWARTRIDVAVAVSAAARDTAHALCGGTYEVLFNGVDLARFRGHDRAPGGVGGVGGGGPPVVLFLGRHERRKGLAVLLEAFAAPPGPVAGAAPLEEAVLWVAGTGPDTERLQAEHPPSERIRWLGVITDEEVVERLSVATVLCAPSLGGESFGMVLLEGMAAGCAVVASDIPGYRDAAGGHAALVPPGDARALAARLAQVLGNPPGAAARAAARAHAEAWSLDRLAERYVDLYRRALSARPALSALSARPAGGTIGRR